MGIESRSLVDTDGQVEYGNWEFLMCFSLDFPRP